MEGLDMFSENKNTCKLNLKEILAKDNNYPVSGNLLVCSAEILKTRAGKDYLVLMCSDGELQNKVTLFDFQDFVPEIGSVINITGKVNVYNNVKSIIANSIETSDMDPLNFVKTGPISIGQNLDIIKRKLLKIQNEEMRKFAITVLHPYVNIMKECPAAIGMHHAYVGGWTQHTAEVVCSAESMAIHFSQNTNCVLNMDLILAGSVLHDVGKLEGYTMNNLVPEMTKQGKLIDHICLGLQILERNIIKMFGRYPDWYYELCHIIASHHGKLEWGSPVVPAFPEALIVHNADLNTSKLTAMFEELNTIQDEFGTRKSYMFETALYNGIERNPSQE